jgi:hypothetical protein
MKYAVEMDYHNIHTVVFLLKTRTMKLAETAVAKERVCKHTSC